MELATNAQITVSSEKRHSRDKLVDGNAVAGDNDAMKAYCYHSEVGCVLDSSNQIKSINVLLNNNQFVTQTDTYDEDEDF